jgi:cysteinyl-tRNA synthetase
VDSLIEADRNLRSWARHWTDDVEPGFDPGAAEILSDDLNTPRLVAWLHMTFNEAEKGDAAAGRRLTATLAALGFSSLFSSLTGAQGTSAEDKAAIEPLIAARLAARRAKDFAESDRIRDELAAMGIQLKDGKDPATGEPVTTWEVKR